MKTEETSGTGSSRSDRPIPRVGREAFLVKPTLSTVDRRHSNYSRWNVGLHDRTMLSSASTIVESATRIYIKRVTIGLQPSIPSCQAMKSRALSNRSDRMFAISVCPTTWAWATCPIRAAIAPDVRLAPFLSLCDPCTYSRQEKS